MRKLYVAATEACRSAFECEREVIGFDNANFTEVSIAVMTAEEAKAGKLERVESTAFGIPIVILNECGEVDPTLIGRADSIIDCKADDAKLYGRQIDTLALKYEKKVLPPFFGSLEEYVVMPSLTARVIRAVLSSAVILPAANLQSSLGKTFSAQTCATPTFRWAIC